MSAAKKITIPYLEERDGYLLTAKDSHTAEEMADRGLKMRFKDGMYCLKVEQLPELENVKFKRHKLKLPPLEKRKELEREYAKYLKMEQAFEKMAEMIDAQQEKLSKLVDEIGLRLKPSLPKDSQIYIRGTNTRLHNCVTITKIYEEETIMKSANKYPILERCFDLKRMTIDFSELTKSEKANLDKILQKQNVEPSSVFNKRIFEDVKGSLPPSIVQKCVKTNMEPNYRETHLPNPECIHCGGHLRKDKTCRRCNHSQELE